jgi:hypothetical protein
MAYTNEQNRIQQQFLPSVNNITLPIAPNLSILSGHLTLVGTVTIAGGTTNGTVQGEGGPVNLLKRVRVVGNPAPGSIYPGGNIVDSSVRSLLRNAQFQDSGKFIGEQSGSVLGNGAAGTYPIYLSVPIYWADSNLRQQVATALYADPSAYASLQLQVDTGGATDCFAGTDRDWTFALNLEWDDDRVDTTPGSPAFSLFQEDHIIQIGAANARLNDAAMPQSGAFLSWQVLAEQGQYYQLSDALLNELRVEAPTWLYDKYAQDIRQQMYNDVWLDPSQNGAGLYYVDQTKGIIQNYNPAAGILPYFNVNNPSGAFLDRLRVFTRRVYVLGQS